MSKNNIIFDVVCKMIDRNASDDTILEQIKGDPRILFDVGQGGVTLAMYATMNGRFSLISKLIKNSPEILVAEDNNGKNVLGYILDDYISHDDLEKVKPIILVYAKKFKYALAKQFYNVRNLGMSREIDTFILESIINKDNRLKYILDEMEDINKR